MICPSPAPLVEKQTAPVQRHAPAPSDAGLRTREGIAVPRRERDAVDAMVA